MSSADRERLRLTFDEDAELYDRARPGYPRHLVDDLAYLAGLHAGSRVLEIGPGTGQLTLPLAERGYAVTAVEIGPAMAAVAARKLARFPAVSIVVSAFEDWLLPERPFDLVVSATAFHWIDPAVRVIKAAAALRPSGTLATITTHHVALEHRQFFVDVQECYRRWDPDTPPDLRLPSPDEVPLVSDDLDRSGLFGPGAFRRYQWSVAYTTAGYLDLLRTYSGHRALPADIRGHLLDCIAGLIETRYGGQITKEYLSELCLARRRGRSTPAAVLD